MIHNIDVIYEREIELEDDSFVLTADLSIDFECVAGDVGFVKAEMRMSRTWVPAPTYMREWAKEWLSGAGYDAALEKAEDDLQPDPDRANDDRWDEELSHDEFREAA